MIEIGVPREESLLPWFKPPSRPFSRIKPLSPKNSPGSYQNLIGAVNMTPAEQLHLFTVEDAVKDIGSTLTQRSKEHGGFNRQQELAHRQYIEWFDSVRTQDVLPASVCGGVRMIYEKLSRMAMGKLNPDDAKDIAGYATLMYTEMVNKVPLQAYVTGSGSDELLREIAKTPPGGFIELDRDFKPVEKAQDYGDK